MADKHITHPRVANGTNISLRNESGNTAQTVKKSDMEKRVEANHASTGAPPTYDLVPITRPGSQNTIEDRAAKTVV
jgi:hypothetical protein